MCSCRTEMSVAGCTFDAFGGIGRFLVTLIVSSLGNMFIVGEQCCGIIIKKNQLAHVLSLKARDLVVHHFSTSAVRP